MSHNEFAADLQAWGWMPDPRRPATPMQALMQAAPFETPQESLEEITPFREGVADCFTALSERDRYYINAIDIERMTYRGLAEQLNYSKSQVERWHKASRERLGAYMLAHPAVAPRINDPALDWDTAIVRAITWVKIQSKVTLIAPFDVSLASGKALLADATGNGYGGLYEPILEIGASAWPTVELHLDVGEVADIAIGRHHKYGVHNILGFRELGLLIRMSDKIARIRNGTMDYADEQYIDAYVDLVGYAAIAHMLHEGTFTLPLK